MKRILYYYSITYVLLLNAERGQKYRVSMATHIIAYWSTLSTILRIIYFILFLLLLYYSTRHKYIYNISYPDLEDRLPTEYHRIYI